MEVSGKIQAEGRYEVCEPCCIDGTPALADGYCEECVEYMCNSCFRDHIKCTLCRHHILSSFSQGQIQDKQREQPTQPCQQHTNQKLRYYCRHDDTAACGDCIVTDHKECDMEFIKDLARHFETSSEFKAQTGGETQVVQLKPTNLSSQQYRDPDPRARGFDVGKRVAYLFDGRRGTVTSVLPQGQVVVQWDNGRRNLEVSAGYNGRYFVKLI